jgi:hypothetical protein
MLASEERVALIVRERFHREGGAVEIRRANAYRVRGDSLVRGGPASIRMTAALFLGEREASLGADEWVGLAG